MARTLSDSTLALAGVFQSAWLVNEVAHHGRAPSEPFECMIGSLFQVDPPDTVAVYGGVARLETGLRQLAEHLGGKPPAAGLQIARYVAAVLHLERKLVKNPELMRRLGGGISQTNALAGHFSIARERARRAGGSVRQYREYADAAHHRRGEHGHQPAGERQQGAGLALAAVRSAVLWRQSGTRMQLLFRRRQFADEALPRRHCRRLNFHRDFMELSAYGHFADRRPLWRQNRRAARDLQRIRPDQASGQSGDGWLRALSSHPGIAEVPPLDAGADQC